MSEPLKSVGVGEGRDVIDIYWHTSKLKKILEDHPEINIDIVKQIPNVLENPVLILENPDKVNRIVLFGDVYGTNDIPVMVALELLPTTRSGVELDNIVVVNAYTKEQKERGANTTSKNRGKDGTQHIIDTYRLLYTDPNKKRTDDWMAVNRLQLPLGFIQYGPIGTVSYVHRDVKGNFSSGEDFSEPTDFQKQLSSLKERMSSICILP